jgi:hypothetical protein
VVVVRFDVIVCLHIYLRLAATEILDAHDIGGDDVAGAVGDTDKGIGGCGH